MNDIHEDKGHGPDMKYSLWRRNMFPLIVNRRDCYTTDVDWLEWRHGKPVAFIECRRVIGSLKSCEDVIRHFRTLNNGFQLEAYARLAYELKIRSFVVAINDSSPDKEDYKNAEFLVEEIIPPTHWPAGRINLSDIQTKIIGKFNEKEYAEFISGL